MSKMIPFEDAKKVYDKILAIDIDLVDIITSNHLYQDEFAKAVRSLLKELGISSREVSVKKAVGSMCYWIEVTLPHIDRGKSYREIHSMPAEEAEQWFAESREMTEYRDRAVRHLDLLIEHAFPGNADRSDVMTDYFDFSYTMR